MVMNVSGKQETAKQRYEVLKEDRQHYLDRGRECSELTIPALLPDEGFVSSSDLYTPYNSTGARGVNHLASKLLLLLLPPNAPFFRLSVIGKAKKELDEQKELKSEIEKTLGEIEREVSSKIEQLAFRVSVFEALKHLIVTGNALIHVPKKGKMKVYNISQYVCRRDTEGELLEVVTKEMISPISLDDETRELIGKDPDYKDDEEAELYTHIYRLDNDDYYVCQEVNGFKIQSSQGTFKSNMLPYLPLRMILVNGESYGRSFTEEFLGDLKSIEGLNQSLVESAAASSKVVFMIRPNSVTKKRDLSLSRNGDIITGSSDDVSVLQTEKQYDLQVVERSIQRLEERLAHAFLLHTAVQRDAERVTAQEIRYMAQQLEQSLGGVYSLLSLEFQLPLVSILMKRMTSSGEIPKLPENTVQPTIVTGIEALGRGNDLQKLREFVGEVMQLAQASPEVVQTLNTSDLIKRIATGLGIDTEGLVKSEEQMEEERMAQAEQMQQQQMMGMVDKAVSPVANNLTQNIDQTMQEEG